MNIAVQLSHLSVARYTKRCIHYVTNEQFDYNISSANTFKFPLVVTISTRKNFYMKRNFQTFFNKQRCLPFIIRKIYFDNKATPTGRGQDDRKMWWSVSPSTSLKVCYGRSNNAWNEICSDISSLKSFCMSLFTCTNLKKSDEVLEIIPFGGNQSSPKWGKLMLHRI